MTTTRIFHITHIKNLPSILAAGGLWCDNKKIEHGIQTVSIAHANIKERRANVHVPTACGGTVDHYVPFYFAPRSPMLYANHTKSVQQYQDGQCPIMHFETTIERILTRSLPFTFTDGGADSDDCTFFEDVALLSPIVAYATKESFQYWFTSPEYPDRTHRRNAEFLVHNFFPWDAIHRIGVIDADMQRQVLDILATTTITSRPEVIVDTRWYFD